MLNCKKGDLAIVLGSTDPKSPNLGKIVRCLEFIPAGTVCDDGCITEAPSWVTDIPLLWYNLNTMHTTKRYFATDKYLRPLRGDEGTDETLEWAGKPEEIYAR